MSKNKKLVHIHAKCTSFEIFEVVPESRSVQRLMQIRSTYKFALDHNYPKEEGLVVKTRVVNPELNFTAPTPRKVNEVLSNI